MRSRGSVSFLELKSVAQAYGADGIGMNRVVLNERLHEDVVYLVNST